MGRAAAIDSLFANKEPRVRMVYEKLLSSLAKAGPVKAETKKSSIHLVRETSFAGVHPKKTWLDLTIRSDKPIKSKRVRSQEQVSKNRWHQDVRLTSPTDVDGEVVGWLKKAYALASG